MIRPPVQMTLALLLTTARVVWADPCLDEYKRLKAARSSAGSSALSTDRTLYQTRLTEIAKMEGTDTAKTTAKSYKEMYNKMGPVLVQYVDLLLKSASKENSLKTDKLKILFKQDDGRLVYDLAVAMLGRKPNPYGKLEAKHLLLLPITTKDLTAALTQQTDGAPGPELAAVNRAVSLLPKECTAILGGVGGTSIDGGAEVLYFSRKFVGDRALKQHRLALLSNTPVPITGTWITGAIFDVRLEGQSDMALKVFPRGGTPNTEIIDGFIKRMNGVPTPPKGAELTQPDRLAALDLAKTVEFDKLDIKNVADIRRHFEDYVIRTIDGENPDPEKGPTK